jgi:WD40 repeat protein
VSGPARPDDSGDGVHLEAAVHGPGTVNQAGHDQHIHYGDGIRRVPRSRDGAGAVCPYPGLAAFTGEQAGWFFGRDELTAGLLARMDAAVAGGGPVMVVAASGAGKSSLLQAGLLQQIAGGALPAQGSRDWPRVVIVPGMHPMRAAAAALAAALPAAPGQRPPEDAGANDLDALLCGLTRAAAAPGGPAARVVLVVDQFEELFTLCDSEAERGDFISWLWRASAPGRPGGPLAVVACGLRADFYAQCVTGHEELRRSLQADQVVVGPMPGGELRQAIAFPARAVGLEVEAGLADLLLSDLRANRDDRAAAGYDAGRLPLLAHALRATWQQRHGSVLTVDGYRSTGGIDHAIGETADRVYAGLDPAGQREARLMFLRLVKIGDAPSSDARRPVTRPDLATSPAAGAVLDACIASRMLTSSQDAVQITHEALLSAWPKLKGWLEDDRTGNLTRQRLEDTAAEWQRAGREASLLYRGTSLEAAASWEDTRPGELTQAARDFLAVSRQRARRATVIRRGVISILTALTLSATTAAGLALWQGKIASQQRDRAISNQNQAISNLKQAVFNQIVAEAGQLQGTNQSLAAQLNLTAWQMHHTPALTAQLLSTSTAALANPVTGPASAVLSVAFSPDGRTLAAGTYDDKVWLWNVTSPGHPTPIGQPLTGPTSTVDSVAFSPDGRTLAAASDSDYKVWLWNVTSPGHPTPIGQPLTGPAGAVLSVAFSPDSRTLAAGTYDDKVWLWNVTSPGHPTPIGQPLTGPAGIVLSVAFSPDGRTLAAASYDGAVWLWNVTSPGHPTPIGQPLTGPTSTIYSVAFSPDSRTLAAASGDDKVWLWNVTSPGHPTRIGQPLTGPAGIVFSVAFSPDSRTMAAASSDDKVWLWNIPSTVVNGPAGVVLSVAFSPDGRTLAAGSGDDKVWLWNVTSPGHPTRIGQPLTGPTGVVDSVAFSPDSRTLAAASVDDKVWLWNVTSPGHPTRIGQPLTGPTSYVFSVAFSPDSRTLAAASPDGGVWLWNVTSPGHPTRIGQPLTGPVGIVLSVAFSPNGRTLAAASSDGGVWVWNVTSPGHPTPIGQPLTGPAGRVDSVAFSPDGRTLAGSSDDMVWLWNPNVSQVIDRICATTSGNLTPGQWTSYIPQLPYDPPCRHR